MRRLLSVEGLVILFQVLVVLLVFTLCRSVVAVSTHIRTCQLRVLKAYEIMSTKPLNQALRTISYLNMTKWTDGDHVFVINEKGQVLTETQTLFKKVAVYDPPCLVHKIPRYVYCKSIRIDGEVYMICSGYSER